MTTDLKPLAGVHLAQLTAQERAEELRRVYSDLQSDDAFLRRAAFEIAIESNDPLIVKMAIDAAMDSDDVDLRTDAMRAWLALRARLAVALELPSRPSPEQEKLYADYEPLWFTINNVGLREVELNLRNYSGTSSRFQGSFIPGGIRVDSPGCRLELLVLDKRALAGSYGCGPTARLLATVDVQ